MSPVFAANFRQLADLKKEWDQLQSVKRLVQAARALTGFGETDKSWLYNAALSSGVSGLYTGMEEVLRDLLYVTDGVVPKGESSHRLLLDQASVAVKGLRPAILSEPVYEGLKKVRRFRHFERHNYRFSFEEARVEENDLLVETLVPDFIADIERFGAFMSEPI